MIELDPEFHPQQLQIVTDPARFKVVAAGRRWGKSRLGVTECLKVGLEGGRAWWVAPTYSLATEGWRPLATICRQIPGAKVREVHMEVELPSGGLIQVRSAKPGAMRGAGLDLVVVDEAAFIRGKDWWLQELRPSLSSPDRTGRAMFISTPKGYGNMFSDLYDQAGKRDGWARFRFPTSGNPFIDPVEVDEARDELGSLVFSQEYLAEFVEMGGTILSADWFRYYKERTRDDGVTFYEAGGRSLDSREGIRFVTVDLAASVKEHADYTVILGGHSIGPDLFVTDVFRARVEAPDIIPAIKARLPAGAVAHIERAGFQLAIIQMAQREGLPVKELAADRDKLARALPLAARMEAGHVWFLDGAPWLGTLERELLAFTGGQQSEHDDQVDALGYAVRVAGESGRVRVDLSSWDVSDMIQSE